jgi:hypothetical protein
MGLAITGASTTAVTALGLTGATAFGLGVWFDSTPQQRAYIAGFNAVNCAVEAVLPLKFVEQDLALGEFNQSMRSIDANIEKAEKAIGAVNTLIAEMENAGNRDNMLVLRAKQDVAAAVIRHYRK